MCLILEPNFNVNVICLRYCIHKYEIHNILAKTQSIKNFSDSRIPSHKVDADANNLFKLLPVCHQECSRDIFRN